MTKDKIFLFLTLAIVILIAFYFDVPRWLIEKRGEFLIKNAQKDFISQKEDIKKEPVFAKGVYVTFSTASNHRMEEIIDLIKRTELNAVVIDIKDVTGIIPFDTENDLINQAGSEKIIIKDMKGLIDRLHRERIYAIARIAVFEDNFLPTKRPDLAIRFSDGRLWRNFKGLTWLDPASEEVWDYTVALAREAIKFGFDEINLDYIRFPSDGPIAEAIYPFWDRKIPKAEIIRQFFEYFSSRIKPMGVFISGDLFGLTLTGTNDLNIGQWLEYAAPYFDYICPMVYPSHYHPGFDGFENPALHPYEVIYTGLTVGAERLASISGAVSSGSVAKLRPWLQDFDMGAVYDSYMINLEKKAVYDAGAAGWLLWNPKNIYTEGALEKKE